MAPNPYLTAGAGALQMGGSMLSTLGNAAGSTQYNNAIQSGTLQSDELAKRQYNQQAGLYGQYTPQAGLGMQGMQGWNQQGPGNFQGGGSVNSFLDPSIAYQQDQVGKNIQAATGPVGLSGSALKQLARQTQNVASTGYNNAFNQQQQANTNAYQQFSNNFAMRRQSNQDNLDKFLKQIQVGQYGTQGLATAGQNQFNTLNDNLQARTTANANNAYTQNLSPYQMWGNALGAAGQTLSSFG